MWQMYKTEIIIGAVVGLIITSLGFLISANWILRVMLLTVILVGEAIYLGQVIRVTQSDENIIHPDSLPPELKQPKNYQDETRRNSLYIGGVIGLVVIVLVFLISTNWILRVILLTFVLVGEAIYAARVVRRSGAQMPTRTQSRNEAKRRGDAEKKSTEGKHDDNITRGGSASGGSSADIDGLLEVERAEKETKKEAVPNSIPEPETTIGSDDGLELGDVGGNVDNKPVPPPAPPAKPAPAVTPPAQPPQNRPASILEETPAEASVEEEEEDFFETGVYDDGDIDLEAVEAYRRSIGENSSKDMSVHFSTYYPKEIKPNDWQPLHTYIYRQFAEAQVQKDAQDKLGERIASFRQGADKTQQTVAEGATIAVTPYLPGFQFNPPVAIIGFYKEWHRLDFEVRATDAPTNQASNGRLTFTVEGLIVGDIPLSIFVGENISETSSVNATQKIYEAIFASYSHSDTVIVERVERAFKALGLDYLRDVTTLRSGQDWNAELLNMIDRADVFQLFWSDASAQSKYVRQEWEYALKLGREGVNFIRPVYWKQPMPNPPSELGHIHFAYQPDLDD